MERAVTAMGMDSEGYTPMRCAAKQLDHKMLAGLHEAGVHPLWMRVTP